MSVVTLEENTLIAHQRTHVTDPMTGRVVLLPVAHGCTKAEDEVEVSADSVDELWKLDDVIRCPRCWP